MAATSSTLTLRLPEKTRGDLDKAARVTRRSRSFLVKEALARHLQAIVREETAIDSDSRIARLMKLKGSGSRLSGGRAAVEIDAEVREFRGDD